MPPSGTKSLADATFDVIYRMDYAVIEAGKNAQGWAAKRAALAADFAALGYAVPPSVLDRTMSDLEAMARSGGVSVAENQRYWNDEKAVLADLAADPAPQGSMDPFYDFSGHFSGFVAGARRAGLLATGPVGMLTPVPADAGGG